MSLTHQETNWAGADLTSWLLAQERVLARAGDHIAAAIGAIPSTDGLGWRSSAQRLFSQRLAELHSQLSLAPGQVEWAQQAVAHCLSILNERGDSIE